KNHLTIPASKNPHQQANTPPTTLPKIYNDALPHSPSCNNCKLSSEKAEKVVKPPSMPVTSSKRSSGFSPLAKYSAQAPIKKLPNKLTVSVAHGCCTRSPHK